MEGLDLDTQTLDFSSIAYVCEGGDCGDGFIFLGRDSWVLVAGYAAESSLNSSSTRWAARSEWTFRRGEVALTFNYDEHCHDRGSLGVRRVLRRSQIPKNSRLNILQCTRSLICYANLLVFVVCTKWEKGMFFQRNTARKSVRGSQVYEHAKSMQVSGRGESPVRI